MPEDFFYFAYGSNMFTPRLTERTPSAKAHCIGYVLGRRLTFSKPSKDGSGKCDIEAGNPLDKVFGVVFKILKKEKTALDAAEGLNKGYDSLDVQVVALGEVINATAYVATDPDLTCIPYSWYKALVVAGAVLHGLPTNYIECLRATPSKFDPDGKRRSKAELLLLR